MGADVIIGIDPGVSGAVGVLTNSGHFVGVLDIPTVLANKSSNRRMVSPIAFANLLREICEGRFDVPVITENVNSMPGQGVASMFAMGKSYGIILGVLATLGISVHLVSPQKWKKFYALGKDKEQSRELAQRMWPDAPLDAKKDHNRAESLLLAKYYADVMPKAPATKRPRIGK